MGETAMIVPIILFLGLIVLATWMGGVAIGSVPRGR